MKNLFRRLSSKGQQQKEHGYRSPTAPRWPSFTASSRKALPAPVGSNNPAFSDHESQAAQQQFLSSVYQEYPQKLSHNHDSISVVASDAEPRTVAQPSSQVSNKASAHANQADSSVEPRGHDRQHSANSAASHRSANFSPNSPQNEVNSTQHEPQQVAPSIYKSYNDIDIMSSGNFDFDHNALLSTAPSADWFAVDRSGYRPRTAPETSSSRPSQQWNSLSASASPAQLYQRRHAHQQKKAAPSVSTHISHISPRSDSSSEITPVTPDSHSPMAAMGRTVSPPAQVVTPFAKYADKSMHQPLTAEDIDSAMQPGTQLKQQLSGTPCWLLASYGC